MSQGKFQISPKRKILTFLHILAQLEKTFFQLLYTPPINYWDTNKLPLQKKLKIDLKKKLFKL